MVVIQQSKNRTKSNFPAAAARKPAMPIQERESGNVRKRNAWSQALVFIDKVTNQLEIS